MNYKYNEGTPTLTIDLNEEVFNLAWFQGQNPKWKEMTVRDRFEQQITEAVVSIVCEFGQLNETVELIYAKDFSGVGDIIQKIYDGINKITYEIVGWLDDIEIPKRGKPAEFTYQIQWR